MEISKLFKGKWISVICPSRWEINTVFHRKHPTSKNDSVQVSKLMYTVCNSNRNWRLHDYRMCGATGAQSFIISYMHMYIRKNPNLVFKHIWLAMIWKFFVNASTENSPKCQPINTCSLKTVSSSTPLFVFLSFNKYLYCEPTKCYLCIFLCAGNYNIEHIRQKRILVSWSIYILVGGVRQ